MNDIHNSLLRGSTWNLYVFLPLFLTALYLTGTIFYNLFLHPLRKYPGPKLWAASPIPYSFLYAGGLGHKKAFELHQRYGDIVRVAPNNLLLDYPEVWKDVMGHASKGRSQNPKEKNFYAGHPGVINGANNQDHARIRKVLAPGFSAQTMMDCQPAIQKYVDLLMDRLKLACKAGTESVEMTSWFNFTTFDIIGDLTFGEPFGCLERSAYHPWVSFIFDHIRGIALLSTLRQYPLSKFFIKLMHTGEAGRKYAAHMDTTISNVAKRLDMKEARPDLVESMLVAHKKNLFSFDELHYNTSSLIVGGSETTATSLSGTTYLLATHPEVLAKLTNEVRSSFSSEEEIDLLSVQRLDYLMAVANESFRLYPPVPAAIPREAPPEGTTLRGEFIPRDTILSIWQWAMFRNPKYFRDAELFAPERWLKDERFVDDQTIAVQPFNYGPRNCIGKNLAYAEIKLILSKLLWNFDLEMDPRSNDWFDRHRVYLLWDKPELFIRLRPSSQV